VDRDLRIKALRLGKPWIKLKLMIDNFTMGYHFNIVGVRPKQRGN